MELVAAEQGTTSSWPRAQGAKAYGAVVGGVERWSGCRLARVRPGLGSRCSVRPGLCPSGAAARPGLCPSGATRRPSDCHHCRSGPAARAPCWRALLFRARIAVLADALAHGGTAEPLCRARLDARLRRAAAEASVSLACAQAPSGPQPRQRGGGLKAVPADLRAHAVLGDPKARRAYDLELIKQMALSRRRAPQPATAAPACRAAARAATRAASRKRRRRRRRRQRRRQRRRGPHTSKPLHGRLHARTGGGPAAAASPAIRPATAAASPARWRRG